MDIRILFTFVGGRGHFQPLVPLARAAERAGHTVAFGCAPSAVPLVESEGFECHSMGSRDGPRRERIPLRRVDRGREDRDLRERFARLAARARVPLTSALCSDWQPDVLVCDETDFGAMLAAELLGLPFATVSVIATGSFVRPEVVGEPLHELRAEHGLPPDPKLAMLHRYLVVSPFPPSFRDPASPAPPTMYAIRGSGAPASRGSKPAWANGIAGAPTVYFTLGTIFNTESGDLSSRVLDGLRGLRVNSVVTVGPDIDPAELGPQPAHVHVASFLPQDSVLPHCDAVVSHGGSGSVLGALAHGLPSVLIPLGADQPRNADRCAELGVALALDAMELTPKRLCAAVSEVLEAPEYRSRARRFQEEIALLPDSAYAVALLERLARDELPPPSGEEGS